MYLKNHNEKLNLSGRLIFPQQEIVIRKILVHSTGIIQQKELFEAYVRTA